MRALVRAAATSLAIMACGPNPYFKLAGESNDGGASSGSATTLDESTGADVGTGASTTPEPELLPCDPAPITETPGYVEDASCPISVLLQVPPSMTLETMIADVPCGTQSRHFVMRMTPTELWECPENCEGTCDGTRTINISKFLFNSDIDAQLPQPGSCAQLLHVSKLDENNVCTSAGYAFWDADGAQQLRLAAAAEYDPFDGVPELEIDVTPTDQRSCEAGQQDCQIKDVSILRVALDGCFFDAPQNGEWQDIRFDGREYRFSSSAYNCFLPQGPPVVGWYLRRQQL